MWGALSRLSERRRRWEDAAALVYARLQKDTRSIPPDIRVAVEEFLAAHYPLVEILFLDRRFFSAPPPRITALSVRFALLALTVTSMDRSLGKLPALRAQLPEIFAPLFDEPVEAVRMRLTELGQSAPGVAIKEQWEVTGKLYVMLKRVVFGGEPRVRAEELNGFEGRFRPSHEKGVRRIARRLASASSPAG